MIKHLNITVSGEVHGVFYRVNTEAEAKRFHINGFVQNESNGDVYIEVEGEEAVLKRLIDWCWVGPKSAVVKDVKVEEGPLKNFYNFVINR